MLDSSFLTFRSEGDAALSLVDAAIATVARRDASGWVATFDSDFREVRGVTVVS